MGQWVDIFVPLEGLPPPPVPDELAQKNPGC